MGKSELLLAQLGENLQKDEQQRNELIKRIKGIVVFVVDKQAWTLDLREGKGQLAKGAPADGKPDITLTMTDATFVSLVTGKIGSQQAFLMRKLQIKGSMGLAMKLQPILDAAAPKSKL